MDLNKSNESSFLNSPTARTIARLIFGCFMTEEQRHLFKAIYAESDLIDPRVFAAYTDTPQNRSYITAFCNDSFISSEE